MLQSKSYFVRAAMELRMNMLNPALRGFFEAKGMRNYVLYGGRASSKTYHTAGFCVWLAMNYRAKFLCARQFQNRISDSVKSVRHAGIRPSLARP